MVFTEMTKLSRLNSYLQALKLTESTITLTLPAVTVQVLAQSLSSNILCIVSNDKGCLIMNLLKHL